MRNEKTFFKWSFGLRFLFVFLCTLMCVGNAWGASTYTYNVTIIPVYDSHDGTWTDEEKSKCKVAVMNSKTTPSSWATNVSSQELSCTASSAANAKPYLYAKTEDQNLYFWGFYDANASMAGYDESSMIFIEKNTSFGTDAEYDVSPCKATPNGNVSYTTNVKVYARFRKIPFYRYDEKLTVAALTTTTKNYGRYFYAATEVDDKTGEFSINEKLTTQDVNLYTDYYPALSNPSSKNTITRNKLESASVSLPYWVRAQAIHGKKVSFSSTSTIFSVVDQGLGLYRIEITKSGTKGSKPSSTTNNPLTIDFVDAANKTVTISKTEIGGKVETLFRYNVLASNIISTNAYSQITLADGEGSATYTQYKIEEEVSQTIKEGDQIELMATASSGYIFAGWYKVEGTKTTLVTNSVSYKAYITDNVEYFAKFIERSASDNFLVGNNRYENLSDALEAVKGCENKTILVLQDVAVAAGKYTIPSDVTLLIPYSAEQTAPKPSMTRVQNTSVPTHAYCVLTLESGAHLDVFGVVEVGGIQTAGPLDSGADIGPGRPGGDTYGVLYMKNGSSITMNNGSNFRAWGYVLGDRDENGKYLCEIEARRGAIIQEHFQMMDWKGGDNTIKMFTNGVEDIYSVLPINQYFVQNIEVPTLYRPGSKLLGAASVNVVLGDGTSEFGVINMDDAGIIGVKYAPGTDQTSDAAIFLMDNEDDSEDTWVRKYYDIENDRQVYEINNSAYLGSLILRIVLGTLDKSVNSIDYVLPITNNFYIHLLSGQMQITQRTELLPGTILEIDKESTMIILPKKVGNQNKPQPFFLYDADEWGKYVSARMDGTEYVFDYASQVKYRPGTGDHFAGGGAPNKRTLTPEGLGDAKLIVHGSVDVRGYLKTTDGGASITSSIEDAGTIVYTVAAPNVVENDFVYQISTTEPTWEGDHVKPALLKNDAQSKMGTFSSTANTAAGQSFCFIDFDGDGKGEWMSLTNVVVGGCNMFVKDQNNVHYIKPQAYVPISIGLPHEEADHTYRDHYAGTNRIFIEVECVWWEVEETETPGIFYSELNNTYYYYDSDGGVWTEKKFNVVFKNWDGTVLTYKDKGNETQDHYELPYGSHPQWLSAIPSRPDYKDYTYTFDGWMPDITSETEVKGDMVFVAKYIENERKYLITFLDADENEVEVQQYTYGEQPIAPQLTNGEKILKWTPSLGAVIADQTYTASWLDEAPATYTITWKNWDGTTLKTTTPAKNTAAATVRQGYGTVTPQKEADANYNYNFNGWYPSVTDATSDATYTATYSREAKGCNIRFFKEGTTEDTKDVDGNLIWSTSLAYGEMPTPPTGEGTTKASTAQYTYTLVWNPLVGTVTGNQDYTATFEEHTRQYTVTWKNWDNSVLAVDYVDYNSPAAYSGLTPKRPTADNLAYTFTGWNTTPATKVTANVEYTAQYSSRTAAMTVNTDQSATPEAADATLQTLTITPSGVLNMGSHKLTVDNLILQATETTSGQLLATNVTATNAYFDLTINATTTLATGATRQWHAFGVPWQVNIDTDPIQEIDGEGNVVRTFALGRDYDIIYYNGDKRATSGPGYWCWEFLENHAHQLQPGQGYMIAFVPSVGNVGTIRLAKKNFAPVMFSGSMSVENSHGEGLNNGWNAIANPKACNARLNAGPTTGYVYDPANDNYKAYDINGKDYIVGRTVYVQVNASGSVVINNASGTPISPKSSPAYRERATDKEYLAMDDYYQVAISSTTTEGGHIYVLPEEDKENKYVIGHDLAQFGMSTAIPQIWVNRYDTKLALNTTALINEAAEFPMGVYAPTAGEYTISLNAQPSDEYNVYLTRDGQAIWNLSDGAFTTDLKAGIQSNYGLRLTVNKAPLVVTGVDEAVVDAKGETRKVMINNQVYIIRGEQVYTIDGQLVK